MTANIRVALMAWGLVALTSACRDAARAATASHAAALPVRVAAAPARRGDQPRYLDGLGTVTASSTAVIRARVDGPLTRVAFREGQVVHAGDLLAVIDKRTYAAQLAQARAQLARDQASLASARADLAHYEAAREALPAQQIEHGHAAVDAAVATLAVDRAQVDALGLALGFCEIRSPIDGVIGLRAVDVGNIVHASDTTGIAVVTQVQPITVVFTLPQDQLPAALAAQRTGPVTAAIYDRDLAHPLASGQLLAIDNQIDRSTGTVRLKAEVDNRDGALFPNQFVNVRLLAATARDVVLVPAAAIQPSPGGALVYVVRADRTIEVRPVEVGSTERDLTVVSKGLAAGELVVTAGVDKLAAGTRVVVAAPDAAGSGASRAVAGT